MPRPLILVILLSGCSSQEIVPVLGPIALLVFTLGFKIYWAGRGDRAKRTELKKRIVEHLMRVDQATVDQIYIGLRMSNPREKGLIITALQGLTAAKKVEVISSMPDKRVFVFDGSMMSYRLVGHRPQIQAAAPTRPQNQAGAPETQLQIDSKGGSSTLERLKRLLTQHGAQGTITPASTLQSLGFDELEELELMMAVTEEFGPNLDDFEPQNVLHLARVLDEKIDGN